MEESAFSSFEDFRLCAERHRVEDNVKPLADASFLGL